MSRIRRRHFLQLAGSSLAAIGLSQVDFLRHGNQMHRALAQTTPRKLALLVGINNYPTGISSLGGCVNDVRLQYELLVHRYGFNPQDILIVTDSTSASGLTWAGGKVLAGATREQIIQAFQGHLGMAQPGDVALFHYSGHGSYVKDPHPIDYANSPEYLDIPGYQDFEGFDGTLVPTDSLTRDRNKVNDIMGSTLFLLSRAINTDNFTMVLDSCHAGGGVRGNLVYRSVNREAGEGRNPSDQEMELQTTLRQQVGLGEEDAFKNAREAGIAKGVAMGAARANQLAAEQSHSGLQAGIFTYLLTRYLWQVSSSRPLKDMFVDLARITRAVDQGENQDPIYFVQPGTTLDQEPPYLLPPSTVAAEAAIRSIRSNQSLELWLGGMTPNALKAENSIYEVLDQDGTAIARVQQVSGIYNGLTADAHFIDANGNRTAAPENVGPGSLLQEEIRGLNTDFKLTVGLHQSLGADLEEARQVLANYDFLTPTVANGASDTDILLGRFDDTVRSEVNTLGLSGRVDVEALGSGVLGLFHNDLKPLLDSFGSSQYESMGAAFGRLLPRLRLLLAKKILNTLVNTGSTGLLVDLEVGSLERGGLGVISSAHRVPEGTVLPVLTPGEILALTVTNRADHPLYVAVLGVEDNGTLYIYHPSAWNAPELESQLGPGESLYIHDNLELEIYGPAGFFNVMVIASREQLRDSLRSLQRIVNRERGEDSGDKTIIAFEPENERTRSSEGSAVNIFGALVDDMSRAGTNVNNRNASVDHDAVVAFTATIEVVA